MPFKRNNPGCPCCGDACISGGCPTGTYQATPTGSQTKKGWGGPCAFVDLQNAPGGWGKALVLTFRRKTSPYASFGFGSALPLLPNKKKTSTAIVPVTEGAGEGETPAYTHPKKGACQYLCYIEDAGALDNTHHPNPGDDSYIQLTRKSDGSIELKVQFQPGSGPQWTDQKTGTGSIANHWVSGKTYNKSTSAWDSFGGTGSGGVGTTYASNTQILFQKIHSDVSSGFKGCCGTPITGNNNLGGKGGPTAGGAAH
jgi:hypothetical protein